MNKTLVKLYTYRQLKEMYPYGITLTYYNGKENVIFDFDKPNELYNKLHRHPKTLLRKEDSAIVIKYKGQEMYLPKFMVKEYVGVSE